LSAVLRDSAKQYLAFDLGAESGRAILGQVRNGVITIREVRRFDNEPLKCGDSIQWDVARLWLEVRKTLMQAAEQRLG